MNRQGLLVVSALVLILFTSFSYAGSEAPALSFTTDEGEQITNESLKGNPTLLVLWASWCGVCQRELPNVKTIYEQNKEKGLRVLAIGVQDKKSSIARYVENHPETFTFPVVHDQGNQAANGFNIRGVPLFVLLNAEGEIAHTHVGGGILKDPTLMRLINNIAVVPTTPS